MSIKHFLGAAALVIVAGCAEVPLGVPEASPPPVMPPPLAPPPPPVTAAPPHTQPYAAWDILKGGAPTGYAAYGYVVFTAGNSAAQTPRYAALCEAFKNHVLVASDTLPADTPTRQIAVTYWPVTGGESTDSDCAQLVRDYDYARAQVLLKVGRISGVKRGPFLVATAGTYPNGASARALVLDLSHVEQDQFGSALQLWREHIVEDPAVWDRGLRSLQGVAALVDFLNQYGCTALKTVGFDDRLTTACA